MAPPKTYVFAITRRDQDYEGLPSLIEIHSSLESANAAAKAHLTETSATARSDPYFKKIHIEEEVNKDGGYEAFCDQTYHDERDNFVVQVRVEKMELKGPTPNAICKDAPSSADTTAKQTVKPATAADPALTPSSKNEILEFKKNSLKDVKLLFTGTFDTMNRKTCEATAKSHGAQIMQPNKLGECDFVVRGTKAGQKKLDEIEEIGMKTISEVEFIEMLGEPPSKKRKS